MPDGVKSCIGLDHIGDRRLGLEQFFRNARSHDGYTNMCRGCLALLKEKRAAMRVNAVAAQLLLGQTALPTTPEQDRRAWRALDSHLPSPVVGVGTCPCCHEPSDVLIHYVYGERGKGAFERKICADCDRLLRDAKDDVKRLLLGALFLTDAREHLRVRQVARVHVRSEP